MTGFISIVNRYFAWWLSTLVTCVPHGIQSWYRKFNQPVELIIAHQGETVFVQDANGRIIDSKSLKMPDKAETELNTDLDFNLQDYSAEDSSRVSSEGLDIGSVQDDAEPNVQAEVVRHLFSDAAYSRPPVTKSIEFMDSDETTLLFNREDSTTRLIDMVGDQDTVIIDDDQGTLLTNTQAVALKDNTILYISEHGKIRAVESPAIKAENSENKVDFLLNEDEEVESSEVDPQFSLAASMARRYQRKKRCLYLVPDERVFTVNLSYPIQALENIDNVLRYDLEKHIPLSIPEVRFFYALNISADRKMVNVDTVVIKADDYDALQQVFDDSHGHAVVCTSKNFYKKYGLRINFLDRKSAEDEQSWITWKNLHAAFNFALLLILLALPYYLYQNAFDAIESKSKKEVQKVSSIVSTINRLNSETDLGSKLAVEFTPQQRMVYLLAQLSEHIDSDAWITRFSYENGEIKVKGEAASATTVSDSLNQTGLFENIKFVSSIVKNPKTGKESFELSLRVKPDA